MTKVVVKGECEKVDETISDQAITIRVEDLPREDACEETQPKVTKTCYPIISTNTSRTCEDHVITESVFIEPKYHFQAIGINQCVLSALEKIYKVKVVFNDVNNKIIIYGVSKNVNLCKADIDFNMSVRRWWDQEPKETAALPGPSTQHLNNASKHATPSVSRVPSEPTYKYKYSDIREGSSNPNFNTVETFTTNHVDVVIKTVYIEPKYHFQAIGRNECVLKALEKIYNVKVVFNEFNNKICIQGSQKQVNLCKEDVEFNMSVRRWWDEEPNQAAPPNNSTQHQKNENKDTTPSISRETIAAKEEESITSRVPSKPTYKYSDIREGSSNSNFNTVETFTTNHDDVVIQKVYIESKYHFQAIGKNECVLKALEKIYNVKVVFNEFNNKIFIQGSQKQVNLCKEDVEFNMSVRRWWDEEPNQAAPPNNSTQHQNESTNDASQNYYRYYEGTNDDAASQDYYRCYESSSQYEAACDYYQYYDSTDHYAASRQYYWDCESTSQNEAARDYYHYYDSTNDYEDARDYYHSNTNYY